MDGGIPERLICVRFHTKIFTRWKCQPFHNFLLTVLSWTREQSSESQKMARMTRSTGEGPMMEITDHRCKRCKVWTRRGEVTLVLSDASLLDALLKTHTQSSLPRRRWEGRVHECTVTARISGSVCKCPHTKNVWAADVFHRMQTLVVTLTWKVHSGLYAHRMPHNSSTGSALSCFRPHSPVMWKRESHCTPDGGSGSDLTAASVAPSSLFLFIFFLHSSCTFNKQVPTIQEVCWADCSIRLWCSYQVEQVCLWLFQSDCCVSIKSYPN